MNTPMLFQEQLMRFQQWIDRKENSLASSAPNERIVVCLGQIITHNYRVVVGKGHPSHIEGPMMPRAEANAVTRVITAIEPFGENMSSLNFGLPGGGAQVAFTDRTTPVIEAEHRETKCGTPWTLMNDSLLKSKAFSQRRVLPDLFGKGLELTGHETRFQVMILGKMPNLNFSGRGERIARSTMHLPDSP
jgi:hypothetical protein